MQRCRVRESCEVQEKKTENIIHGFSFVNIIIARKYIWCEKTEGINNIFDNYRYAEMEILKSTEYSKVHENRGH